MNSLVRAPVEGEALGPAKTEPPVNVIVGGRVEREGGKSFSGGLPTPHVLFWQLYVQL